MSDDLAEEAAELIQETNAKYQERKAEQEAFIDAVAEEEGEPPLETQCNIVADYTVPLKAKMNGDLIDRMSAIQAKGKEIEANPEEEGHEISRIADEMCQILADVIDDPGWQKDRFYAVYREEGPDAVRVLLERAFTALKEERERRQGNADGFRQEPSGT